MLCCTDCAVTFERSLWRANRVQLVRMLKQRLRVVACNENSGNYIVSDNALQRATAAAAAAALWLAACISG